MKRGSNLIIAIIFGGLIVMSSGALISLLIVQQRTVRNNVAKEQALQVAEAGLNRYRWILAHDPEDFAGQDKDYVDADGDTIGHYTVTVTPPQIGSTVVTLTATGWTTAYPNVQRTLRARYGQGSYAEYAVLTDANIWFGEEEEVHGKLHSNGGIRMDGTVDSQTTSIQETYICGAEHGCDDEEKPGIWGDGGDTQYWDFPIADGVDFDAITLDLETMHEVAEIDGILLGDSGEYGYHIVFNNTGTFTVYVVTKLKNSAYGSDGKSWRYFSYDIKQESVLAGYENVALPASGIIFVEDDTWVSGQVAGRVTVAAAKLPEPGDETIDIMIPDNITYYPDRTSGSVLGLVAQHDVTISLEVPTDLTIDAALLAQTGQVYRVYFHPNSNKTHAVKNYIETYGTVITHGIWTWSWVNASGNVTSGFQQTNSIHDPALVYAPPPYFPTKDEYTFLSWEEL
ncbi:MAG: hypothetical protein HYV33_05440 [Candidatus Kerfeldbacteria bacterium]|nr:hypothetical protein [Candidatus Kerfeldbacteria bacterium]